MSSPRRQLLLRPTNRDAFNFMVSHPRCCLFADMGMGKTISGLITQDARRLCGYTSRPTLVIGPKRVATETWPTEVARWDSMADTRISVIAGKEPERLAALKVDAEIYTIGYHWLPWLVQHYMERWPFGTVIADESTRLKGFRLNQSGERAKWLGRVAHSLTDYWINLTGTPSPNGLKDLWGQMWYIDRGVRLGRTYTAFTDRWFQRSRSGHGYDPLPFAQEQIQAAIKDVCLTLDPKDYFDVREPKVNEVRVTIPPKAMKVYKRLEATMFAELESASTLEVFNAAALTNKCLQFANGAVYTKYPEWEAVHDAKIEAVESIAGETSVPLLIAYEFKSDLVRLKKAFPTGVELATDRGLAAFKAGDAAMGFAHPGSMGHGIDGLQYVTNILVRFGHGWDMEQRMQMAGRIGPIRQAQAGLNRVVEHYDIIADGTMDDLVIARHVTKRNVQDLLLAACKRRK